MIWFNKKKSISHNNSRIFKPYKKYKMIAWYYWIIISQKLDKKIVEKKLNN